MVSLNRKVAIVGIGYTPQGREAGAFVITTAAMARTCQHRPAYAIGSAKTTWERILPKQPSWPGLQVSVPWGTL